MPITAISLVSLQSVDKLQAILQTSPYPLRFELSYEMSRPLLDSMRPLLHDSVVSVHAPCPNTEFFPNLASNDASVIRQSYKDLQLSLETTVSFGGSIIVLHPGYATDLAIPSHNQRRQEVLSGAEFHPYIWKEAGSICIPSYIHTGHYLGYKANAMANLKQFANACAERGVMLAVENLNPRVGYLFQTPEEMIELVNEVPECSLCLDVGHLWISSCLYGFDYYQGIQDILATGKVVTTHLHSNSSHPGADERTIRLEDDHASLDKYQFPYKWIISKIAASGANMVLEVKEDPLGNYLLLMNELDQLALLEQNSEAIKHNDATVILTERNLYETSKSHT